MNVTKPPSRTDDRPSIDRTISALSDPLRRDLLDQLPVSRRESISFDDLLDALTPGASAGGVSREELSISLHHVHLPMLADSALVEVDWTRRTVRSRTDAEVESLLTAIATMGDAPGS